MRVFKMPYTKLEQKGFTIVELMIATAVFSTVLLLCSIAVVQVGRVYYKGIITNRTEETGRKVVEDVSQAIQFGATADWTQFMRTYTNTSTTPTRYVLCLGVVRYTYVSRDISLGNSNSTTTSKHVLWKDRVSLSDRCTNPATTPDMAADTPTTGGQELLSEGMRVVKLGSGYDINTGLWSVDMSIAYGDNEVFSDTSLASPTSFSQCLSGRAGGQFCSVINITTTAKKRL